MPDGTTVEGRCAQVAHVAWESMRLTGEVFGVHSAPWEAIGPVAQAAMTAVVLRVTNDMHPTAGAAALHKAYCELLPTENQIEGEAVTVFSLLPAFRERQYHVAAGVLGAFTGARA